MVAPPIVRTRVLCDDIATDPLSPSRVSLLRLVYAIRGTGRPPYPLIHPELCAFAQPAGCRGTLTLWVEVRHADTDAVTFRTRTRTTTFPNDPLAVPGWPIRLRNLLFMASGLYWIQLWCDGVMPSQQPLRLT